MANITLHFALGILLGAGILLPRVMRALSQQRGVSAATGAWLAAAYALGVYAIVPHLLARAGVPDAFCRGWWMNIFLLHPLIGRLRPDGGALSGQTLLVLVLAVQYTTLLIALAQLKARSGPAARVP